MRNFHYDHSNIKIESALEPFNRDAIKYGQIPYQYLLLQLQRIWTDNVSNPTFQNTRLISLNLLYDRTKFNSIEELRFAQIFVNYGAAINLRDHEGNTLLHVQSNPCSIRCLLTNKLQTNANTENNDKQKPADAHILKGNTISALILYAFDALVEVNKPHVLDFIKKLSEKDNLSLYSESIQPWEKISASFKILKSIHESELSESLKIELINKLSKQLSHIVDQKPDILEKFKPTYNVEKNKEKLLLIKKFNNTSIEIKEILILYNEDLYNKLSKLRLFSLKNNVQDIKDKIKDLEINPAESLLKSVLPVQKVLEQHQEAIKKHYSQTFETCIPENVIEIFKSYLTINQQGQLLFIQNFMENKNPTLGSKNHIEDVYIDEINHKSFITQTEWDASLVGLCEK